MNAKKKRARQRACALPGHLPARVFFLFFVRLRATGREPELLAGPVLGLADQATERAAFKL